MEKQISTIEHLLGENISNSHAIGGGCIAYAQRISTDTGKVYFLKSLTGSKAMFHNEANGLKELGLPNAIRIPKVILVGDDFLLLEFIKGGIKSSGFFTSFGKALAKMHRYSSNSYGFYEDNFIGKSPQYNVAEGNQQNSWSEFYFNKRLLPQLHMAEKQGLATPELNQGIKQLENKLPNIIGASEEKPSLLHGDLWGGNFMCSEEGLPVLIDPAVHYGHREADLAMTKMFGGFTSNFYEAYQNEYPLAEGWEYRENLYLLYHYLNHLNLFGNSYYSQCMNLINYYQR